MSFSTHQLSTPPCSRPGHLQYLLDSSLLSFCSSPYSPLVEKVCCYCFVWIPESLQALLWGAFPSHSPPQVWCLLLWDISIWENPLGVGRLQEQCSAVCAFLWVSAVQSSQIWTESSTSWARTMMIMIEYVFSGLGVFFLPLPNLGYLHCKPDSVECWVCLKPALERRLCPLKPASFLNMECSQLTPWEINYGWFNQPRFWLTDSRDSSCLFWKGQNDCTKNYMSCSNFWLSSMGISWILFMWKMFFES